MPVGTFFVLSTFSEVERIVADCEADGDTDWNYMAERLFILMDACRLKYPHRKPIFGVIDEYYLEWARAFPGKFKSSRSLMRFVMAKVEHCVNVCEQNEDVNQLAEYLLNVFDVCRKYRHSTYRHL